MNPSSPSPAPSASSPAAPRTVANAPPKHAGIFAQLWHLTFASINSWLDHRASSKGAALAFYTLFSMAPILVLVIAIAGMFFGAQAAQGQIVRELSGLVGPTGAEAVQLLLAGASNTEGGKIATIIATIVLLVGATTVFAELKDSLDEIWEAPKQATTGIMGFVTTRLLSFSLILVLGFLLLVSLALSAFLTALENYWSTRAAGFLMIMNPLSYLLSFLVIAALFGSIFKLLPRVALSWRDVSIGALGTAALFTLGKFLIGVYLGNSGVSSSYGAAGSLVALLLWVYYSAQIFFFGAEFTRQFALSYGSLRHVEVEKQGTFQA